MSNTPTPIKKFKLSVDDYHRMIDLGIFDDKKVELIEGELIEMSPEKPIHSSKNSDIFKLFYQRFSERAEIRWNSPITLASSEPEPDLVVCKNPASQYKKKHPHPQDIYLVLEVANTSLNYDLTEKRRIYVTNNIKEYWVVSLEFRHLIVFREPGNNDYLFKQTFTKGKISLIDFPEIEMDVEELIFD
jgi:Uma2 family endonuclease